MTHPARVVIVPGDDGPLRVVEATLPDPTPHQVVVRQFATGVCHSQLHEIQRPRREPFVLGHESTGEVVAAGDAVTHVAVGDRVLIGWVPRRPLDGRAPEGTTITVADGSRIVAKASFTWADTTVADECFVVPLPAGAPTDVTSIVGCAVMTGAGAVMRTAEVGPGESVAVIGVGGVGLAAVGAAAIAGAHPIIAVDLDPAKLELARRLGATHVVDASSGDAAAAIHELTRSLLDAAGRAGVSSGVDYAFDCIGIPGTVAQIVAATRNGARGEGHGGTAVLVGIPQGPVEVDVRGLLLGEKTLATSLGGSSSPEVDFPILIDWHMRGRLDLDALVTRRYRLDDINDAVDDLASGRIAGRAIVEFDPVG